MKEILETHPVANLKKILKEMKQEVGSYSKMKKAELVARILELKKKGFPVPKVEMYVKPERKKKFKGVAQEPSKKSKEIEKERSRLLDVLEKYPSFKDTPRRGTQSKHELYTFLIYDAKTIKSLKEVERLIERAGKKKEPKKEEEQKKKDLEKFDDEKKRILKLLDNPAFERLRGNAGYFTLRNELKREIFHLDKNTNFFTVEGSLERLKEKEKFIKEYIKEKQEEKKKTK
jgi:hypothetical protein